MSVKRDNRKILTGVSIDQLVKPREPRTPVLIVINNNTIAVYGRNVVRVHVARTVRCKCVVRGYATPSTCGEIWIVNFVVLRVADKSYSSFALPSSDRFGGRLVRVRLILTSWAVKLITRMDLHLCTRVYDERRLPTKSTLSAIGIKNNCCVVHSLRKH